MVRIIIGVVFVMVGILGVLDALFNPKVFDDAQGAVWIFLIVFAIPGILLIYFGRRFRRKLLKKPITHVPTPRGEPKGISHIKENKEQKIMSGTQNIKVRTSGIRALLVRFVNFPVTGNEASEASWFLTQKWNPLLAHALADTFTNNQQEVNLGGFHAGSLQALVDLAHKAGEQYSDCDLVIQTGGISLMLRSTGRQENVDGLLLTVCKTEGDRRKVVVGGNLTLIPG